METKAQSYFPTPNAKSLWVYGFSWRKEATLGCRASQPIAILPMMPAVSPWPAPLRGTCRAPWASMSSRSCGRLWTAGRPPSPPTTGTTAGRWRATSCSRLSPPWVTNHYIHPTWRRSVLVPQETVVKMLCHVLSGRLQPEPTGHERDHEAL